MGSLTKPLYELIIKYIKNKLIVPDWDRTSTTFTIMTTSTSQMSAMTQK